MKVGIHAAKTTLSKLIEKACAGEEVIIARDDIPVVRLVPIEQPVKRQPGTLREKFGNLDVDKLLEPLSDDELDLWEGKGS